MAIELTSATAPAYLKMGLYGHTGCGKTFTAAKTLSQFIAEFLPGAQLAMFDTEPSGGYVAPMVKKITGKDLLTVTSRSFPDLMDFAAICLKEGFVALLDSATHPWRSLCEDYLDAKRSRIKSAGGRVESARLVVDDYGPIKSMWNAFAEHYSYDPVHWMICGREGDVWNMVEQDDGKKKLEKTGTKMKTETELAYEPSLLAQMILTEKQGRLFHTAHAIKDRFAAITGLHCDDPDIEFFRPHIEMLNLGGKHVQRPDSDPAFVAGHGPNWSTILAKREACLDNIKDDIHLAWPGQTADAKTARINALRKAFNTSSWVELQKDTNKYPLEELEEGRQRLRAAIKANKKKGRDPCPDALQIS